MHDRKRDLLWQTRIITEVYLFLVYIGERSRLGDRRGAHGVGHYNSYSYVYKILRIREARRVQSVHHNRPYRPLHSANHYKKNTLPWWYVFVTVGHVFYHACTSMTNLWQNQNSHTCAVVEVFHDITKIIIMEVSTSMTINRASWKCFRQGCWHVASTVMERR